MKNAVFVTGGTVGSGYAIAERFAKEGYDVFIGSREEERANEAAKALSEKYGVNGYGFGMKVFNEADVKRIFAKIREMGYLLDTIVLNAANLGIGQDTLTVPIEEFMNVINTNMGWNFMLAREAALQMKEKGAGSIVFITSNTAYRAVPNRVAYSSSKSGILGLARTLALDLGKYGIKVNSVLPGMIKTDRWESNYNDCKNAPSNFTPIGDIADFEDIANAVYYFGGDGAKNTTGAELRVDGGNTIQLYPIIPENK